MKTRKSWLLHTLIAILLCAALTLPVFAAATPKIVTNYDNAKELFGESLQGNESMAREQYNMRITRSGEFQHDRTTIRDLYQKRTTDGDVTVSADATVADIFEIEVRKGETLTIEKGVTLTVYGVLSVEGKLVNNGTIVIGYKDRAVDSDKTSTLHNRGRLTNNGVVNIRCGELVNDTIGRLDNKGTINITNAIESYKALQNLARQSGEKLRAGQINNTGEINVKNTKGTGIYNAKNAVIKNDGVISRSGSGTVDGKVTGNAVKAG